MQQTLKQHLEETAASLEEITSNITNNTQTTIKWLVLEMK